MPVVKIAEDRAPILATDFSPNAISPSLMISTYGLLMSLNDPKWGNRGGDNGGGRRPNQGPPDLDELWRDFNRRLSDMFGKRRPGDNEPGKHNPPPADFDPKQYGGGIAVLLAVIVLGWLASGFYTVDATERAVILQFGVPQDEPVGPGLHWRLPKPIQSHERVPLTLVRTIDVGIGGDKNRPSKESLMLTDDENIVSIGFQVQYVLNDPKNALFTNRFLWDDTMTGVAETAMREVVGKNKMDFVINEGREQVAQQAQKLMQAILDKYESGISISRLNLKNIQPPEQVQAAFNDALKAGQDRDRQINEGQAYANDVVPRAKGNAARLEQEAEAYQQKIILSARGDASRFDQLYSEYAKAPKVTRDRLYLETMQQIYSSVSKVMIDARGQGNLLYLPFDKLMQAAAAAPALSSGDNKAASTSAPPAASSGTAAAPAAGMEGMAASGASRDRDAALQFREREGRL